MRDGEMFFMKEEKRNENKFWNTHKQQKPEKQGKPFNKGWSHEPKYESLKYKGKKGAPKASYGKQKRFRNELYEQHLAEEVTRKGLTEGTLFEGVLRVNQNNRKRAFVTVKDIHVDLMIDGLKEQNRAFDGDTVVIELL